MKDFPSITLDNFVGMDTTDNKLSLQSNQLSKCLNMLYSATGGIYKRTGGAKLSDPPSAGVIYGVGNYKNNNASEYLVCAQGTDLYYYSSGWNALSLTLTTSQTTRFESAGYSTNRALYAVNGSDSIVKIYMSGINVVATQITIANGFTYDSPTTGTCIKLHKNRLFVANKDTLYFSDSLAFDTWPSANNIQIAPGIDGYIQNMEVWGDALFIFKEYGVYVLPNAADANPTTAWKILKADALTGTKSPDTVKRTKIGIVYLSSDNKIRYISPDISFSSAEYTLGGSGSPVISYSIERDLMEIDDVNKTKAVAIEFNNLYILSYQTVNNGGSYNDKTFFCDMDKFYQKFGVTQLQPYCGEFSNFDYNFFVKQTISDKTTLYGVKGADGVTQETLDGSTYADNGIAINGYGILGWSNLGDESYYKKMRQVFCTGKTENNIVTLKFDGYKLSADIPDDGSGTQKNFQSSTVSTAIVGTGIVGTSVIGTIGITANKYRLGLKGHYFKIEFSNNVLDQYFSIDKFIIYFMSIKRS